MATISLVNVPCAEDRPLPQGFFSSFSLDGPGSALRKNPHLIRHQKVKKKWLLHFCRPGG